MKRPLLLVVCILLLISTNAQNLSPKRDKETKKHGFVNASDEWIVKPIYDKTEKFRDGFAKIILDKKEGLIDETGKVIVEPQFDDIEKFEGDLAIVKNNKKYGFINKEGKLLLEPKFDKINDFKGEHTIVINNRKKGIVSNKGQVVIEPKFDEIELPLNDFTYIKDGELWGVVKSDGSEIFKPEYVKKFSFNSNGLSIAEKSSKYGVGATGIVNKDGSVVVELNQGIIKYEPGHFFILNENNKWYITDDNAKAISGDFDEFKPQFSNKGTNYLVDGRIIAKKDGKYGFIDKTGNPVIPFNFDEIGTGGFGESLCAVKVNNKWGYINTKGEYFYQPEFEEAGRFEKNVGGIIAIVKKDGLEHSLNGKSKELLVLDNLKNQAVLKERANPQINPQSQAANNSAQTNAQNTNQPKPAPAPTANNNDWLLGTWTVTEEKMGGQAKTGNSIKYVKYEFKANGSGTMVERTDIAMNTTTTKNITWKLANNKLTINGNVNYTLIPAADKKTMTMNGILGSSWKLKK